MEVFPFRQFRATFNKQKTNAERGNTRLFAGKNYMANWSKMKWKIDHFAVIRLLTWPLNGSEGGVDLVLVQTLLLLLCKTSCSDAN